VVVTQVKMYPITLAGGNLYRLAINAPTRGVLYKCQVVDYSATKEGFTYTLFNAAAGCPPTPLPTNPATPVPPSTATVNPWDEDAAQIMAPRTANSGEDRYIVSGADGGFSVIGTTYSNADGGPSGLQAKLYLQLNVVGSGAKTFGIFLLIGVDKG
jgi:hypothetical protein